MSYRVLVVDDEEIMCNGLKTFVNWGEYGFEVAGTANSVAQALVFLESNDIDVVISDIKMPVQDGLSLLAILSEEYPDVKAIILSGYGEFEYAQQAMRFGALDFLTKPINFNEMKRVLMKLRCLLDKEHCESLDKCEYRQLKLNNLLNILSKNKDARPDEFCRSLFEQNGKAYYLFRVQLIATSFTYQEISKDKQGVLESILSVCKQFGKVSVYNNEFKETACILWPTTQLTDGDIMFANSIASELKKKEIAALVGISLVQNSIEGLYGAYVQAGRALQYRMIKNKSDIISFSQLDGMIYHNVVSGDSFDTQLLQCLANPQKRSVVSEMIIHQLNSIGIENKLDNQIYSFCVQVLLTITNYMQECSVPRKDYKELLSETIHRLLQTDCADEVKKDMREYAQSIIADLNNLNSETVPSGIVENAKYYINEHYAEDITLNTLAEQLYIHPTYFSRLFKEKTGENFIDYVTKVRISKSKALLSSRQYHIYDISSMVGYDSSCYFSKLFKNVTGITPKQYRDSNSTQS